MTSRPPSTPPSPRRPRRRRCPRTPAPPCWTGSPPAWRRAQEELARLLAAEAGKPLALARGGDRARRLRLPPGRRGGHPDGRRGDPHGPPAARRTALGPSPAASRSSPISAIIPFNFPVLLAAHKLAPAIACGATMVLKVPPQDPLATLLLGEIVRGSGYPAGAISILLCTNEDAAPLIDDPRVRMVTFTGSARAGWAIRQRAFDQAGDARAGRQRRGDHRARRRPGACRAALRGRRLPLRRASPASPPSGSWCTSRSIAEFTERFVAAVGALRTGDPIVEGTDVGPMIDEANAERAAEWIAEAAAAGARVAVGGAPAGRDPPAHRAARHDQRDARKLRGDLRAGHHRPALCRLRRGHRRGERLALRHPGRALHQRHAADPRAPSSGSRSAGWW